MTDLYPAVLTVLVMGGLGVMGLLLANVRGAWAWLAAWVLLTAGFGYWNQALVWPYVIESLGYDVPWLAVGLVALWTMVGASGALRPASFLGVLLGTACFGSMAAWVGLGLAEADDRRRARLVAAATGAALLTPWASPASLTLGTPNWQVSLLGLVLAVVGFAPGGTSSWSRPRWGDVARASLLLLWVVLLVWLMRQGGLPDFLATGLEALPMKMPGAATVWVGTVAAIFGSLLHPGGAALLGGLVMDHASQLRGPWAREAMQVGLTVGAGLPALLLTRAKITVALPLWALQVVLALTFLALRYAT